MNLKDACFMMFYVYILLTVSPLQACELQECKERKKYIRFSTSLYLLHSVPGERERGLVCILLDYFHPLSSVSSIFRLSTYLTVSKQVGELQKVSF